MTCGNRLQLRQAAVLAKGWASDRLSKGCRKHIRRKLARERKRAFERAQEERVRARSLDQAAKKKSAAVVASSFPVRPVAPPAVVATPPRTWWTCRGQASTGYYAGPCNELNSPERDICGYCGARRPSV